MHTASQNRISQERKHMLSSRRLGQAMMLAAMLWAGAAISAEFFSDALNDLKKYIKAASTLMTQTSTGLDGASFHELTLQQRDTVNRQLKDLDDQLRNIFVEQSSLISNLEFFISTAKDPSKSPAERNNYWEHTILTRTGTVRSAVGLVKDFAGKTDLFNIVLSPETYL